MNTTETQDMPPADAALLAACKAALDFLAQEVTENGRTVTLEYRLGMIGGWHTAKVLRDAIAKAEGRETS